MPFADQNYVASLFAAHHPIENTPVNEQVTVTTTMVTNKMTLTTINKNIAAWGTYPRMHPLNRDQLAVARKQGAFAFL